MINFTIFVYCSLNLLIKINPAMKIFCKNAKIFLADYRVMLQSIDESSIAASRQMPNPYS